MFADDTILVISIKTLNYFDNLTKTELEKIHTQVICYP